MNISNINKLFMCIFIYVNIYRYIYDVCIFITAFVIIIIMARHWIKYFYMFYQILAILLNKQK